MIVIVLCNPFRRRTPALDRRLRALAGDVDQLEHELSRAIVEIDALRRRVAYLERREHADEPR